MEIVNDFSNQIAFKKRLLWHLLFWIVATGYLMLAFRGRSDSFFDLLLYTIYVLPSHIAFVYISLYLLIPRLLLKRKYILFVGSIICLLGICALYVRYVNVYFYESIEKITDTRVFFRTVFGNLNLGGIAIAIKMSKSWYVEREAKQQAEKAELISQLQLLKSQIHPHFLFNTLNNLYSLTIENSSQSPVVVLKLSSLLRYMLHECNSMEISLGKEIEMLRNYIDLEQIRYGTRLELAFNISGNIDGKTIAPLLLLPFLENCFKHGSSKRIDQCWINVDLSVEGEFLYLKLTNGNSNINEQAPEVTEGFGLTNVKKRLNLLYPGAYSLKLISSEDSFTVSMKLELRSLKVIDKKM